MDPRLKARVLTEWRGLPEVPFPQDTSRTVGTLIEQVIGKLGIRQQIRAEEINLAWKEVVGDFLAKHAAPAGLKDGVLVIHVLQPTVHFELERVWKRTVLQKLQARFGRSTVKEIRFRLG